MRFSDVLMEENAIKKAATIQYTACFKARVSGHGYFTDMNPTNHLGVFSRSVWRIYYDYDIMI